MGSLRIDSKGLYLNGVHWFSFRCDGSEGLAFCDQLDCNEFRLFLWGDWPGRDAMRLDWLEDPLD